MPFDFKEHTADVAFQAWGRDLPELFASAAEATLCTMVDEISSVRGLTEKVTRLEHEEVDLLLVQFLQELIYFKDAEALLLRVEFLSVEGPSPYRLEARLTGEEINPLRHEQRADVKAVTLHGLKVEESPGGWECYVILDV